jgi:acetate kinase
VARVLVVNAGSSTVKLGLIGEHDDTEWSRELEAPQVELDPIVLRGGLGEIAERVDAVGHRIVHGGERFRAAVRVDPDVEAALRSLVDLAPLHQPKSLAALDAVSRALRSVPAVACFDTAFHATLTTAARTYPLPAPWRERWQLRRYGFHGLSHSWIARRAPVLLGRPPEGLRIVSCHLGAGASLCAIADGRSIDTTMGFTPLEGLVMATRSGSVDPGLLLWLLEHAGVTVRELADVLEHDSGLKGLSGTADMRAVLSGAAAREAQAHLALEVYLHRLRAAVAAMVASLGGIDALVFTGGVGERSPEIREQAASGLGFLGVNVDEDRNRSTSGDGDLSANHAAVSTLLVHSREDLEIARQTREVLS